MLNVLCLVFRFVQDEDCECEMSRCCDECKIKFWALDHRIKYENKKVENLSRELKKQILCGHPCSTIGVL